MKAETKIVDLTPFTDGSDKQSVARDILLSLKSSGFVYISHHGMAQDKIDSMFEWSKRFFDQPMDVKQLAPHPSSGTHHRGLQPWLIRVVHHVDDPGELAKRRAIPDVKESFECGRENDDVMPNIWLPDGVLTGFKEACLGFFWACYDLERTILSALAMAFGLPEEYFWPYHMAPDNQLRLLHYPAISADALASNQLTRIDGHSDFGTLTILFQDDVGGLEVEDSDNPPVPPVPGSIVVNAGDFLSRWSNDTIKSAIHRVRGPSNSLGRLGMIPARYSIPYDFTTVVDLIPGTWSESYPKRHEPSSPGEYVMKRLAASY
ncbi:thymine dioxygenase [Infundibulicybe gibba]|nr:thymine dioxygenase [Infundibulicybe gibba]